MLDEWLTEQLGYSVYNSLTPPDSDERSLTCAKVNVDDVRLAHDLLSIGFQIIEVNGRFEKFSRYSDLNDIAFAQPEHHQQLLDVAASCFQFSRLHRDPLTSSEADRIKREWLRNCLDGHRGLEVLVALDKKKPVGFLAVGSNGRGRAVDLLGVDREHQGKGIGRRLLRGFTTLNNSRWLDAGTSLSNTAAVRLYQSCGFKLSSASIVLHLHRGLS